MITRLISSPDSNKCDCHACDNDHDHLEYNGHIRDLDFVDVDVGDDVADVDDDVADVDDDVGDVDGHVGDDIDDDAADVDGDVGDDV